MTEQNSNPYDGKWFATLDKMPPGPPVLRVKGTLQMPTPGYELTLKEADSQGTDPNILTLDLIVEPPDPELIVPQVITEETVAFEKDTDREYSDVHIAPDGPKVPVEIVS
jgi:hypothetical protein